MGPDFASASGDAGAFGFDSASAANTTRAVTACLVVFDFADRCWAVTVVVVAVGTAAFVFGQGAVGLPAVRAEEASLEYFDNVFVAAAAAAAVASAHLAAAAPVVAAVYPVHQKSAERAHPAATGEPSDLERSVERSVGRSFCAYLAALVPQQQGR